MVAGKELMSLDPGTGDVQYIAFDGDSTSSNPVDGPFARASTNTSSYSLSLLGDSLILYGERAQGALRIIDLENREVSSFCEMKGTNNFVYLAKVNKCRLSFVLGVTFSPLQQSILLGTHKGLLAIDVDQKLQGKVTSVYLIKIVYYYAHGINTP